MVTDQASGEPVAGLAVRVGVFGAVRAIAPTDALGRFEAAFDSVATEFDVATDGNEIYLPAQVPHVASGQEVEVRLAPRAGTVQGTVCDAMTARPVAFVDVVASEGAEPLARARTDAQGVFSLDVPLWRTGEPPARNALRTDLRLEVRATGYLPDRSPVLDLTPCVDGITPVRVALAVHPRVGRIRVEVAGSGTRSPLCVPLIYGAGPRILGRTMTDGLGQATLELPAWTHEDRPADDNEPRSDLWIAYSGIGYRSVKATGLSFSVGAGRLKPLRARIILAPSASTTASSSFAVVPEEPPGAETDAPDHHPP
ncbi:MAG TPA: hypothetical protein PLD23_13240, partial [Armatimonadota bacterium]|nr:hypothetical protein [Armatimonadota bacterium]